MFDATGYGLAGALNVSTTNGNFNDFGGAGGNDTIIGNGNTRLNYQIAAASVSVDLETSAIGTTNAVTVVGIATGATEGTDSLNGVNAAQGSMFGDTLLGSSYSNTFTGLGGDDYIDGRGGFDTASYNSLSTVTSGVSINMAAGTATGDASIGTDTLRNIEGVQGTGFADTFNATGYGQLRSTKRQHQQRQLQPVRGPWRQRQRHRQRQYARPLLQLDGGGDDHDRCRRRRLGAWDGSR